MSPSTPRNLSYLSSYHGSPQPLQHQQHQQQHLKDEDELLLDILCTVNTSLSREQNFLCLELLNGTNCSPEAVAELINTLQNHRNNSMSSI